MISKHKSHFYIENIKNDSYDGVKNSFIKDVIIIILKLKSIKVVNDDVAVWPCVLVSTAESEWRC